MQQRPLGATGLWVSRLGLGTMTWGRDTDEHEARDQWKTFLDAGGTLIDTADVYADGSSEELIGMLLAETNSRDKVVVATKAVSRPRTKRRFDASRAHLLASLDGSLSRLGTDYVDVWYLHAWDPWTPLEETLAAADDAVRSGRVRYVAVSNYAGWQLARSATWQRRFRAAPHRCGADGVLAGPAGNRTRGGPCRGRPGRRHHALVPLGRGVLTGKYRYGTPASPEQFHRTLGHSWPNTWTTGHGASSTRCIPPLKAWMWRHSKWRSPWVRDRPGVTAPIVGARTVGQLRGILESEELELPGEITTALDDISAPDLGYPSTAGTN